MRKLPPLNSLRAFEAAARHQSFTAAAEELSVTITAISHQVRQLEARFGHKLFERTGRAITLTQIGKTIYPILSDGFDQMARACDLIQARANDDSIQISTTRAFAERWLLPRISKFNAIHPDVTVHIHGSEQAVNLRADNIDLAIRYGPATLSDQNSVIMNDYYVAVADQSICPMRRTPTIEDFSKHPLLAYKWGNVALNAPDWSTWLPLIGLSLAGAFRISWYSEEMLALHAAECALGPIMCSNVLIEKELRTGRLRRLEGPILPGFSYRLVETSLRPKEGLGLFSDWLREEARVFCSKVSE